MNVDVDVAVDTKITARVRQVAAMMDVTPDKRATRHWTHVLPLDERPWNIGLVVGPSGAGKTQLARAIWGDRVIERHEWGEAALVDHFPADMGIRDVTNMLSSVGLGDVPAWLRPFRTLSNGEAFRATVARALAEADGELVVVDEFTSVVDRQVAQVASHTVQKAVRRRGGQFVAVTCHYDVEDWLQPDWTYDVAAQVFTWRSVQPHPPLVLEVRPCSRRIWPVFAPHHYLSSDLASSARCFAAYRDDGHPVAFACYIHFPHARTRNIKAMHRVVVLPDYQGLGLANRLLDATAHWLFERAWRCHITMAHPAMIASLRASPRWRELAGRGGKLQTTTKNPSLARANLDPRKLNTHSFQYVAPVGTVWGAQPHAEA